MNYPRDLLVLFFIIYITTNINYLFGMDASTTNKKENSFLAKVKNNKVSIALHALIICGLVGHRLLNQFGIKVPYEREMLYFYATSVGALFAL